MPAVVRLAVKPETKPLLRVAAFMPAIVTPDISKLQTEVHKWDRRATMLYRGYLRAAVVAVAAVGGVLILFAPPLLAPMLGDVYFLGSRAV
nr:hypothetical protein [uncultured Lichenicoccus sp.]